MNDYTKVHTYMVLLSSWCLHLVHVCTSLVQYCWYSLEDCLHCLYSSLHICQWDHAPHQMLPLHRPQHLEHERRLATIAVRQSQISVRVHLSAYQNVLKYLYAIFLFCECTHTCCHKAQWSTCHSCIINIPSIVTDSAPISVHATDF